MMFKQFIKKVFSIWVVMWLGIPQILIAQLDTLWTKTFGGIQNDAGYCVRETSDDGYIIVGSTSSFSVSPGTTDVWLLKTNSNGDTLWTKTYGGVDYDGGECVQQTFDSGYIIVGYTQSYGIGSSRDIWLIKTNLSGDTLWTKTIGGTGVEGGNCIQETSDSGYIIVGTTGSFGAGMEDIYLIKTDINGTIAWAKTIGDSAMDRGEWVQETYDSGYIITGSKNTVAMNNEVRLIKTDSAGDTMWTNTYGGEKGDRGYCVQQTSDSGYIILANMKDAIYDNIALIKTDKNGGWSWTRKFYKYQYNYSSSVQQTSDGGYIIVGSTSSGSSDIWLIKTDSNGSLLWGKTYGGAEGEYGSFVQETSDGSYIVVGTTGSFGEGEGDIWLLKVGEVGVEEKSKIETQKPKLEVSPNPFLGQTVIYYSEFVNHDNIKFEVYDMMGRLVEGKRFFANAQNDRGEQNDRDEQNDKSDQKDRLEVGKDLQTGVYFVKVKGYNPVKIIKLR